MPPRKVSRAPLRRASVAPAPVEPALHVACLCGLVVEVDRGAAEEPVACRRCERKFLVVFETDRETGEESVLPLFVEDGVHRAEPRESVPDVMHFVCPPCQAELVASRAMYDTTRPCPDCETPLVLELRYVPETRTYGLWPRRADRA